MNFITCFGKETDDYSLSKKIGRENSIKLPIKIKSIRYYCVKTKHSTPIYGATGFLRVN